MNTRYRILLLIIIIIILWKCFNYFLPVSQFQDGLISNDQNISDKERIKVSIYYEALCSDSRFFILKNLVPAYEKIPDSIILDFIPYGKAETFENNGEITFHCQHAELECLANKVHACAIDYVKDPKILLKYIACMINDNVMPLDVGQKCAAGLGIDFNKISACVNDRKSSLLLKAFGERTHALNPLANFIPTIELNNSQKVSQSLILKELFKQLCNLLINKPDACL